MIDRMKRPGRPTQRLMLALAAAMVAILLLAGGLSAQEETASTWEQLPNAPGPITRLFAPASGALLVQVKDDLYRSDDGGDSWRPVTLPPPRESTFPRQIVVDQANQQYVYVTGAGGLYRTIDDAASWQLIWPDDKDFPVISMVAPSPIDRDLIYLVVISQNLHVMRSMRSDDGGQTWAKLEENGHNFLACTWATHLLQTHPTDADRVFRAIECNHAISGALVQESRDRGQTWAVIAETGSTRPETVQDPRTNPKPAPTSVPTGQIVRINEKESVGGVPTRLAGGQGALPNRYFLVVTKPSQGGGMALLRTDDDGRVWNQLLGYTGGGGATGATDTRPNVTMSDLAFDPQAPDRLFAAFHEQVKGQPSVDTVRTSTNGGQTWTDLPAASPAPLYRLALGIDSANLYATGGDGLWRLPLP